MKLLVTKLKDNKGETIVEVLISILVFALTMAALCNAVVIANSINKTVQDVNVGFSYDGATKDGTDPTTVTASESDIMNAGIELDTWKVSNSSGDYYYYTK